MNRPQKSIKYRRSVYRKNRIKVIALTATVTAIAISLVFLIVGNLLGNKVEDYEESRKKRQSAETDATHSAVTSINAYRVPLNEDGSNFSTRVQNAKKNGYSAACFYLDTKDGRLLYPSEVAQEQGKQTSSDTSGLRSLKNAVSTFEDSDLYTVGITHVSSFGTDDDLSRAVAIGYHSALVSEALRAGVDDVLIYVPDVPSDRYGELISLADEVRRLCPTDGKIGLSLPPSFFTAENAQSSFDSLFSAFDYVAIDLCSPPEGTSLADYADTSLADMLYYLLRYNVRVLLPNTDADTLAAAREVVSAKGSQNIQIMP